MARLTMEQQRDWVLDECIALAGGSYVAPDAWQEALAILERAWRGMTAEHNFEHDEKGGE